MNCYQFMFSLSIEIKVTISVENPFYSCTGDAVVIQGEYGTVRDMYCGRSSRLHRLGPFCDRFKLSTLEFDSSGLSNGIFNLQGERVQPRPWDDTDRFYPRAVSVWDAQAAIKKAQPFSILINGNIPAGGTFEEFRDGNVATIYAFDPIGTATLSIKKV